MELTCQECGAPSAPHAKYADRQLAKCSKCDAVFNYAETPAADTGARRVRSAHAALPPAPTGITVEQQADDLRIVRRWRSTTAFGMAIFAVLWNALAVSACWLDPMALCSKLPFLFFGIAMAYFTLCLYLNHTVIETAMGVLSVRHRPLPWPGKHLPLIDLDHVYCEEHVYRSHRLKMYHYLLKAVTAAGNRVKLLSVREGPEQVLFVAQAINDRLRVADGPKRRRVPQ